MNRYSVIGGSRLIGELNIQGSKNAVLPILAASLLNGGKTILHNCPNIDDVMHMTFILKEMGCQVNRDKNDLYIDSSVIQTEVVPEKYVHLMRSSIIMLGSVLGRLKRVVISFPGGCCIGGRPIDLHLKAIREMNVEVTDQNGFIICETELIRGAELHLDYPSVGATENILLAAVLSKGTTVIYNAAREPEIVELQTFLNAMGARITGAGSECIKVEGVEKRHDVEYTIMPDRIVAGTYLMAAAVTKGEVFLKGVEVNHIQSVLRRLEEMGCTLKSYTEGLYMHAPYRLSPVNVIRTLPYPGFPTDMQSQIMACLTLAEGTSVIFETIFESRFKHVPQLIKMGAEIITEGRAAIIKGVDALQGSEVYAEDLRGGAALIIAGLAAQGRTVVNNIDHIQRGYESIHMDLKSLGADIALETDE